MKKTKAYSRKPKRRKPTRAKQQARNATQKQGLARQFFPLAVVEILPPIAHTQTNLPASPPGALVRYNPKFYEDISNQANGSQPQECGCCFVVKGLKHNGIEHAPDCLITVPPEHQDRWRQGRNDLLDLYEKGTAPIDEGKDLYYKMGKECTSRNLSEILRRRGETYAPVEILKLS